MQDDDVIIANAIFDAEADNYEEYDQQIDVTKLGVKLRQTNKLKGSIREFQFYANNYFLLNLSQNKKHKDFRINLAWLNSEPEHHKVIIWKWLCASLFTLILTVAVAFLTFNQSLAFDYGTIAGTVLFTSSIILFLFFIYQMRNEYIFTSQFAKTKIFIIENKKPDQHTFDKFFSQIRQTINTTQSNISIPERLIGELKMCRRLRDEGIIDDESYTLARTTIFKHQQYKA